MHSQRISSVIRQLYCKSIPSKKGRCQNKECSMGNCLCMDNEQLTLLGGIADLEFYLQTTGHGYQFRGSKKIDDSFFCPEQYPYGRQLIYCGEKNSEMLQELIVNGLDDCPGNKIEELLENMPVIRGVNQTKCIDDRFSVCYLCLFSSNPSAFFLKLMKILICSLLEGYLEKQDLVEICACIDKIFDELNHLFEKNEFDKFYKLVLTNIHQYTNSFLEDNISIAMQGANLERYYEEFEERKRKREECDSVIEFIFKGKEGLKTEAFYLYRIYKKILELLNIEPGSSMHHTFYMKLEPETAYDNYERIECLLEEWSHMQEEQKRNTFSALKEIFSKTGEICDEEFIALLTGNIFQNS